MRARLTVGFLICLFVPTLAAAGPIRLNFSGNWAFFDPQFDNPNFWSAMNASGVFESSLVSMSLLVDGTDNNVDPSISSFQVFSGTVAVGNVHVQLQPTSDLQFSGTSTQWGVSLFGKPTGPLVGSYQPSYFQFSNFGSPGALPVDLMSAATLLQNYSSTMFLGYTQPLVCGLCLGTSEMTLTSVQSVPEPSAALIMLGGVVTLFLLSRRRKLAYHRLPTRGN